MLPRVARCTYRPLETFYGVSFVYPVMTALGLVMATLISTLFLHERADLVRAGGIAVVIAGVFLVSRSRE
jgi:multidrug transporter EmrE-like cation transporter